MKTKKVLLTALCAAVVAATACPPVVAFAEVQSPLKSAIQEDAGQISPRFSYTMAVDLTFDAETGSYALFVDGISDVTKITGTLTLYKLNSSSKYVKVNSTSIKEYSNQLEKYGTVSTDGAGRYKLTFSGRVYAGSASESISISVKDSY